jgi:formylglycine-generating enzyme required for sulfatase activity
MAPRPDSVLRAVQAAIERASDALQAAGVYDARDLLDALWLARSLSMHDVSETLPEDEAQAGKTNGRDTRVDPAPSVSGVNALPGVKSRELPAPLDNRFDHAPRDEPALAEHFVYAGWPSQRDAGRAAEPSRIPDSPALPEALALARAIRPLARRRPSQTRRELDEVATADRTAEARRLTPVLRPAEERWFDVALVTETTPAMSVWRRTIAEFARLLRRQGAFRDVRRWALSMETGSPYLVDPSGAVRNARELRDPYGRRLILIATDGTSSRWGDGTLASLICDWGKRTAVAALQVLPETLWGHTALGQSTVTLRRAEAGVANAQLEVLQPWWDDTPRVGNIAVPILALSPGSLAAWARLMTRTGSTAHGALIRIAPVAAEFAGSSDLVAQGTAALMLADELTDAKLSVDAELRVRRFREMVSPEAFRLTAYLTAVPLTLPVMRLVQHAMLANPRQSQLAEVLLGGLLERVTGASAPNADDTAEYDFVNDEVREVLSRSMRRSEMARVLGAVSHLVSARTGMSPDEFLALIRRGDGTASIPEDARPFAKLAAATLRNMGAVFPVQPTPRLDQSRALQELDQYVIGIAATADMQGAAQETLEWLCDLSPYPAAAAWLLGGSDRSDSFAGDPITEVWLQQVVAEISARGHTRSERKTRIWIYYGGAGRFAPNSDALIGLVEIPGREPKRITLDLRRLAEELAQSVSEVVLIADLDSTGAAEIGSDVGIRRPPQLATGTVHVFASAEPKVWGRGPYGFTTAMLSALREDAIADSHGAVTAAAVAAQLRRRSEISGPALERDTLNGSTVYAHTQVGDTEPLPLTLRVKSRRHAVQLTFAVIFIGARARIVNAAGLHVRAINLRSTPVEFALRPGVYFVVIPGTPVRIELSVPTTREQQALAAPESAELVARGHIAWQRSGRTVLVAGTGSEPQLTREATWCAEAIGEGLAIAGLSLVTGGWPGVDRVATSAFADRLRSIRRPLSEMLTTVMEPRSVSAAQPMGRIVHVASDAEVFTRSIAMADAVVLIGGLGGTYGVYELAVAQGIPVYPLAGTKGDARRAWQALRSSGLHPHDWLETIPESREKATELAALVIEAILEVEPSVGDRREPDAPPAGAGPAVAHIVRPRSRVQYFDDKGAHHGTFVRTRGRHTLYLPREFRVAKFLVTNRLFNEFVEDGGYTTDAFWPKVPRSWRKTFVGQAGRGYGPAAWKRGRGMDRGVEEHPVTGVSHVEASAFVLWLQHRYRPSGDWRWTLPPEDLWEFTARGEDGRTYPWGSHFNADFCNCAESGIGTTTPVNRYEAGRSPYGCFDMAGNAWEFMLRESVEDTCVLRGGGFKNTSQEVRSLLRLVDVPLEHRPLDFGIRCAQIRPRPRNASDRQRRQGL